MPYVRALTSLLLTLAVLAGSAAAAAGENWPQWRGPGGQGVSAETQVPTEWGPDTNIVWKAELPGTGMSSPIVWGDRIYLTAVIEGDVVPGQRAVKHRQGQEQDWIHPDSVAADKKHTFKVVALDASTGKILWERTAYEGTVFDARHRRSSFAGPTPVTDGVMVYAYFGPEGLYAYDAQGQPCLEGRRALRHARPGHGDVARPLREPRDHPARRGQRRPFGARGLRQEDREGSLEHEADSRDQLGHAGARAERRPDRARDQRQRAHHCLRSSDRKGAVEDDRRPEQRHPHAARRTRTRDSDRGLSRQESHRPSPGRAWPTNQRVAWEYSRGTGYVISNILYGDYLYLFTDNGIVTCLDPKTGTVKYEGGRIPVPARFMGSPVAFGGVVAMTSEEGDTFMLKAGPTHEIVRKNSVDEAVYSSPAIANGRIYIRSDKHLFAIGK